MKVSWNWLKELVELKKFKTPEALADFLTSRGLEVDAIHRQGEGLDKVTTAKIMGKKPHPDADRLSLCDVDTGGDKRMEVVCGATNMKEGDVVAFAPIGTKLPNGLLLEARKIRGILSQGMLCSEAELCLSEESDGILILPEKTKLGKPLDKVLKKSDVVLELSLTPNRGDCLSHLGIAREVASYTGTKIQMPKVAKLKKAKTKISTKVGAADLGPQFYGCEIQGVKVGPSPQWVVDRLEAIGSRSINNVVDATNLVLFELGQPVHAYDQDRLEGKSLTIRKGKDGESVPLLDDTSVTLKGGELVISDAKKPVALAGVMGGGNSQVQDETTNIYLECAEFDAVSVRKAARSHQKLTDSSHRFERKIDPNGLERAISRLAYLVTELAGGQIKGMSVAQRPSRTKGAKPAVVTLNPDFIPHFLGTDTSNAEIKKSLQSLGCKITAQGKKWKVTCPTYRPDLQIKEDLAEEVARVIGYDQIPSTIPFLTTSPTALSADEMGNSFAMKDRARDILASQGLCESIHFSFTSRKVLSDVGVSSSVPVGNPLSEEQEVMVPSLLPGLLEAAKFNQRHHFGSSDVPIRLFELRPTFSSEGKVEATSKSETGVKETWKLSMILSGPRFAEGLKKDLEAVDFYDLKAILENFFQSMGTKGARFFDYRPDDNPMQSAFHPGQTASIRIGKDLAGFAGRLHPALQKKLKLKQEAWIVELNWEPIEKLSEQRFASRIFKSWGEFPTMERDFALLVKEEVKGEQITRAAVQAGKPIAKVAKIFDIYRGEPVPEGMTSVAVRVIFSEEGRSLQEAEVDEISAKILGKWKKDLNAELRS